MYPDTSFIKYGHQSFTFSISIVPERPSASFVITVNLSRTFSLLNTVIEQFNVSPLFSDPPYCTL